MATCEKDPRTLDEDTLTDPCYNTFDSSILKGTLALA